VSPGRPSVASLPQGVASRRPTDASRSVTVARSRPTFSSSRAVGSLGRPRGMMGRPRVSPGRAEGAASLHGAPPCPCGGAPRRPKDPIARLTAASREPGSTPVTLEDLPARPTESRPGGGSHPAQIGYWRCPLWELIQMMSWNSFRLSGPVRPHPLSRTPPIGA
jgi:hypothetical protein